MKLNKEELIVRHLNGTLSSHEQIEFAGLMKGDEDFKLAVEQSQAIWDTSNTIESNTSDKHVVESWNEFEVLRKNRYSEEPNTTPRVALWNWKMLTRVAAVALIVLSGVIVLIQQRENFNPGITYSSMGNHEMLLSMVDGSEAYLAGNSQLEIESEFNRERRTTRLSGTAFFVVKPDKDRVFEVVTNHLKTIVKGTTFLVRTNDHSTTVGVQTGVVEVLVGNQTEILRAGEQVTVSSPGGMIHRSDLENSDVAELKSATRAFKDAPLSSILKQVEVLYSLRIEADSKLLRQLFTVDFGTSSQDDVLNILSTLTQSQVHQKGEIYVLKQ